MAKRKKTGDVRVDTLRDVADQVDRELGRPKELTPERIALAYQRVFDGIDGEIVLADLKDKFNGTTARVRPNGIDPVEMALREGQRSLYLYLAEYREPPPKPSQGDYEA